MKKITLSQSSTSILFHNRVLSRILLLIFILLLVITIKPLLSHSRSKKFSSPKPPRTSREYLARRTLSDFIYGLREQKSGIVLSHFQPFSKVEKPRKAALQELTIELDNFFDVYQPLKNKPIVYIANLRIRWNGETAIARCTLIWNVQDKLGRCYFEKHREVFKLSLHNGGYLITEAYTTPLIIKYMDDHRTLRQKLNKVYAEEPKFEIQ